MGQWLIADPAHAHPGHPNEDEAIPLDAPKMTENARKTVATNHEAAAEVASDGKRSATRTMKAKAENGNTDTPPERAPAAASSVPQAAGHGEPMIIVHVNDRLGTKAAIPCLASDPIKLFKAQVAARIGRQPHEILLKRQGERPFKDQLTLEDYGVSNGVQIDLEIDTGE